MASNCAICGLAHRQNECLEPVLVAAAIRAELLANNAAVAAQKLVQSGAAPKPAPAGSQMAEDREMAGPPPAATAQRGAAGGSNMSKARAHNRPRPSAVPCSSAPPGPLHSILKAALKRKLTWPECERRDAFFHAAPPPTATTAAVNADDVVHCRSADWVLITSDAADVVRHCFLLCVCFHCFRG